MVIYLYPYGPRSVPLWLYPYGSCTLMTGYHCNWSLATYPFFSSSKPA